MEFFRFCPECGRRFHIKLVSKQLVHTEREERRKTQTIRIGGSAAAGLGGIGSRGQSWSPPMTIVREGEPVIVDVEDFQYNYKCKHCGHEWSERHVEQHREG